jgi:thymidylate synthase
MSLFTGEEGYLALLHDIMENGRDRGDRTGVGTRGVFGRQLRFDLADGFPLLTTKKMELKSIASELLWFIEGSGDERRLAEIRFGRDRSELSEKTTIWTANAQADYWAPKATFDGDVGRPYGVQLRDWTNQYGEKLDQVTKLVDGLKNDPNSRRHILTMWNPGELDHMVLPACHMMAQFYVENGKLSCMFTMRSTDTLLGLPYNIASYALLTHMLASVTGLGLGEVIYSGGDVHIYSNHFEAVTEQLQRKPMALPRIAVTPRESIFDFTMEDFHIVDYVAHPPIRAPMAV